MPFPFLKVNNYSEKSHFFWNYTDTTFYLLERDTSNSTSKVGAPHTEDSSLWKWNWPYPMEESCGDGPSLCGLSVWQIEPYRCTYLNIFIIVTIDKWNVEMRSRILEKLHEMELLLIQANKLSVWAQAVFHALWIVSLWFLWCLLPTSRMSFLSCPFFPKAIDIETSLSSVVLLALTISMFPYACSLRLHIQITHNVKVKRRYAGIIN